MQRIRPRSGIALVALAGTLLLSGCWRGCESSRPPIHINPNMDEQPKYKAQEASELFYNGATMRVPPAGTVARGELRLDDARYRGRDEDGAFVAESPIELTEDIHARGAERYGIYCQPCHGARGDGQGTVAQRGGLTVPSFQEQRIRDLPDGQIFDVISNGLGLMPAYAYPIGVDDRWAIVAYVRGLQEDG